MRCSRGVNLLFRAVPHVAASMEKPSCRTMSTMRFKLLP